MLANRPDGTEQGREPASPEYLVCTRPRRGSGHGHRADPHGHPQREADVQMGYIPSLGPKARVTDWNWSPDLFDHKAHVPAL